MSSQEDMIVGPLPEIPDKLYFRIGDVARLANIKPQIFEVFVITKLNKLFRILPDRQEAVASFSQ